jgi:hypothetical protein
MEWQPSELNALAFHKTEVADFPDRHVTCMRSARDLPTNGCA